jgi:hypothetical protein
VSGDHAEIVEGQLVGGDEGRRHEQGLRLGRVADLLGVGHGAQGDQVDPGQGGPPPQLRLDARKIEPRAEEAGLLRTLARGEHREHAYDCGR